LKTTDGQLDAVRGRAHRMDAMPVNDSVAGVDLGRRRA
jgi:hypothetical protein